MNLKTFRADSLDEALRQVRAEFGDNARIVHTRQVDRARLFGLIRRCAFEITATEGPDPVPVAAPPAPAEEPLSTPPADESVPPGNWRRMAPEALNPTILQRNLLAKLEQQVRFGGPIALRSDRCTIVALLGATGVGKTSTIAKIAAHYKMKEAKSVGLLSIDVFRIAATEQLYRYAELIEIPFETVSESGRMTAALRRLADCDLVLLDTPGTNPKNVAKLRMLQASLRAAVPDEVHLLLPATHAAAVSLDTLRRFAMLRPTALTLTKLDEAVGLGDLYRLLQESDLPLRYVTLGQNISEDIEVASPERLASLS